MTCPKKETGTMNDAFHDIIDNLPTYNLTEGDYVTVCNSLKEAFEMSKDKEIQKIHTYTPNCRIKFEVEDDIYSLTLSHSTLTIYKSTEQKWEHTLQYTHNDQLTTRRYCHKGGFSPGPVQYQCVFKNLLRAKMPKVVKVGDGVLEYKVEYDTMMKTCLQRDIVHGELREKWNTQRDDDADTFFGDYGYDKFIGKILELIS